MLAFITGAAPPTGMNIVPDTSVIIDGRVSDRISDGEFADATVAVPEAVVGELESQANEGRQTGWDGLEELQRLADLADGVDLPPGLHPVPNDIDRAVARETLEKKGVSIDDPSPEQRRYHERWTENARVETGGSDS